MPPEPEQSQEVQDGSPACAPPTHALSVQAVTKRYGRAVALDEVSFRLRDGELAVLLGPNGAGKSTLVQVLTGLFAPTAGQVAVGGAYFTDDPTAALRKLGVVFQEQTLDLQLSVRANLKLHAGLHGIGRRETGTRVEQALEAFGLTRFASALAGTLSGGNRRRLELARALLHGPRLLILDEASVGLDPVSRRQLLDLVRDLHERRRTAVLWATHLVDEVRPQDRLLVLHRGRLVFDGSAGDAMRVTGTESTEAAFIALTPAAESGR